MNQNMYLINLETGGNQATIFATNKLRNVVGASELLYRVGTSYVDSALKAVSGNENCGTPTEKNPYQGFEKIISTSGKALLLAPTKKSAEEFIAAWSEIVVTEAPGIDAVAVFSDTAVDLSLSLTDTSKNSYMQVYRETERLMAMQRMEEGRPLARFQRLPIVAECAFSGLPASEIEKEEEEQGEEKGQVAEKKKKRENPVSAIVKAQRDASRDKIIEKRMKNLFPGNAGENILNGLESLEEQEWLAVVHADGNGLGQLFIDFSKHVKALVGSDKANGRNYVDYYSKFSKALDRISWETFNKTVWDVWGSRDPAIVPIVVGGDDLTVVMDGYKSLEFTRRFMSTFCEKTATDQDVKPILECAEDMPQLGMCAGISIAKPHFPFAQSYHIAEGLMKNAKQVKNQYGKDSIALDFHILYDSVSTSIGDIREKLRIKEDGVTRVLTAKPYVIMRGSKNPEKDDDKWVQDHKDEWDKVHKFEDFEGYVRALKGEMLDREKKVKKLEEKLPSSQSHAVRESLFSELLNTQKDEWKFLLDTYKEFKEAWHCVRHINDLYIPVTITGEQAEKREYTYFLDALEAMKFLEKGGEKK